MDAQLTEKRKGEIALIVLREQVKTDHVRLNRTEFNRRVGEGAEKLKALGVTKEEISALYKELTLDAVNEMFSQKG